MNRACHRRTRVAFRHDQDETIGRERKALYFSDFNQICHHADVGQTGRDRRHDLVAGSLLQVNVDPAVCCQKCRQSVR
jgi:hypothetical protein